MMTRKGLTSSESSAPQASQQPASSEAGRYQALFKSSPDAILTVDSNRIIRSINPAFTQMFGYQEHEVLGQSVRMVHLDREAFETFGRIVYPAIRDHGSWRGEWKYRGKDGSTLYIDAVLARLGGDQSREYLAILRDIAEQKDAQSRLRHFKTVVDHSTDAIGMSTPQGQHLYQNHAFDALFGDIGPDPPSSIYVSEEVGRQVFNTIMNGEPWSGEVAMYRHDGRVIDILLRAYPIKDDQDKIIGLVGIHTDISPRKQAEAALKESEERFKIAGRASYDLIYEWDVANDSLEWFGDLDGLLGFKTGEISRNIANWLALIHPDEQYLMEDAVEFHRTATEPIRYEYRIRQSDGAYRYWADHALPLLDKNNRPYKWIGVCTDITERKQAEEEIKQLSQFRESIIENANIWLNVINRKGEVVLWNKAAERISGYSKEEVIGQDKIWEWSYPDEDYRAEISKKAAAIIRNDEVLEDFETTIRRKDGEMRIMSWNSRSLVDDIGQSIGSIAIGRDVTERKRAQDALRESEDRFRAISEESPLGVTLIDEHGRYQYLNPAFVKMFGYTLEDIETGTDWFKLAFPDESYRRKVIRTWLQDLKHYPKGESRPRTYDVRCKDGDIKTIMFRPVTTSSHGQFVLYEDVTESRRAEKALQESELRYRTTFDTIPDSITITRAKDGRYHYVNDGFIRLSGYSREEVIDKTPLDINLFANQVDREAMIRAFMENGELVNYEIKYRRKDGSVIDSLLSARPIMIDGEECLVALGRDVTEIKRTEEERNRLQTQLRQAQKMEAIGTLAGGIAHDFNNILAAIMGFSELGLKEADKGRATPDKHQQVLVAAERAKNLVQQILTFSRKAEYELGPLNLNDEIASMTHILNRTIPKMISVKLELAEDLQLINADPNQIEQVILNLAANARDSMPDGGELVINTGNVVLDENYAREHMEISPGEFVMLRVSDTGKGMDAETLNHIFDPFFTTKDVGKGTGLGLSTVFGIVKGHGGHLACQSEEGKGSVFNIFFPVLAAVEPRPNYEKVETEVYFSGSESILLVDDEEALLEVGSEILSNVGYKTIQAGSGEKALDIYQSRKSEIDLVILDINMPGMGGHKCLERLLEINPHVKVIIASGYAKDGAIKSSLSDGAADFIAKPFKGNDLLTIVREVLDG